MLTTDQKGNVAENAIVFEAVKLGIDVYRPVGEGGRFDMIFEVGERLWRVQCKWAPLHGDVIALRCYSSRRNRLGVMRRIYADGEIDAFAAYCHDLRTCYFLPYELFRNRVQVALSNEALQEQPEPEGQLGLGFRVRGYTVPTQGAIAQLGERLRGTQEVGGSSPPGSTPIATGRAGTRSWSSRSCSLSSLAAS
jgi:hypothetical protein